MISILSQINFALQAVPELASITVELVRDVVLDDLEQVLHEVPDEMFARRIFEKANGTLRHDRPFGLREDLLTLPGDQLFVQEELVQLGVAESYVLDEVVNLKGI